MDHVGQVSFNGARWVVRCEPHVRARLKRVFPRAPQHAAERIEISNTPENCRDLEWFLDRYPMTVDQPDLLNQQARAHRDTEIRINDLFASHHRLPLIELAHPPRAYQVLAAEMLEVRGGLLLADDVGLGKTVTAICSMTRPENLPALVVCPTHMPGHWAEKIGIFTPDLSVYVVKHGTPGPMTRALRGGEKIQLKGQPPDVIIVNYHKLRGWAETLAGVVKLVVYDECQQLRGHGTQVYKASELVASRAHRRVGLSATPIYNYGSEFYWVVNVLLPEALGEHAEFIREWCAGDRGDKARLSNAKDFGAYLRREGIMLLRTRADVGRELPALSKVVHPIEVDSRALENLKGDAIALARVVLAHNERYRGEKMQAAGEFDALMRQATGIAKAPYVAAFVRVLLDSEQRVVLFGWHREVYAIWLNLLAEFQPLLYTGSESPTQKAAAIERFCKGSSRILIMSLRSGAGVDGLQHYCRTVVYGELDWSPGVHEQCTGRVHRDGQPDPVMAYFLHAEEGADPVMLEVLGVKREQIESVRRPDRALVERVDLGENNIQRLAREFLARRGELATGDGSGYPVSEPLAEVAS